VLQRAVDNERLNNERLNNERLNTVPTRRTEFTSVGGRLRIPQSMGRVGSCLVNAAESFFTLEHEVLSRPTFATQAEARHARLVPRVLHPSPAQ